MSMRLTMIGFREAHQPAMVGLYCLQLQPGLLDRGEQVLVADAVTKLLGGAALIQQLLLATVKAIDLLLEPMLFPLRVLAVQGCPVGGLQLAELGLRLLLLLGQRSPLGGDCRAIARLANQLLQPRMKVGSHGNPLTAHPWLMTLTIADISTALLMDTTCALQEIECRMNARAFTAVHHSEQGPAVRQVLELLLEVLDRTSPDVVL